MTNHELAEKLRCTSTVHDAGWDCGACPFYDKQDLPADMVGKYPEDWLCQCDVDRVSLMAADALENHETHVAALQMEIEGLRAQLATVQAQNEQLREANALTIKATTDRLCREWISVQDSRPTYRQQVLFTGEDGTVHYSHDNIDWPDGGVSFYAPDARSFLRGTHWMPLPEPPSAETSPTGQKR